MQNEHRNRASGWKHAKLSGHVNEADVKTLLDTDDEYRTQFMARIGYPNESIADTSIGGLHEKNVTSITGGRKTKSKTDLKIFCRSGRTINVSIKKSNGGQVYFVRAGIFIDVFEKHFGKAIPENVKRAINLFWAAADDAVEIIEACADKTAEKDYALQLRHKSLNAATLKSYDPTLHSALRQWFADNIYELMLLSFSMGAAASPDEWSEFVWYVNLLGENDVDEVFPIKKLCEASRSVADSETYYGESNGGTTIQLPFGFVQWHQAQLQFHHSYAKVRKLYEH